VDGLAIYPGSFDPVTNGHLDIVRRGLRIFPRLVVAVAINPRKAPMFNREERIELLREALADLPQVEVDSFTGLLVEYARRRKAQVVIRGLRALSDFENEFQMAHMNHRLAPEIDTVFFMTALEYGYLSSSLVKEIARFGGDVSAMVPPGVAARLRASGPETPRL